MEHLVMQMSGDDTETIPQILVVDLTPEYKKLMRERIAKFESLAADDDKPCAAVYNANDGAEAYEIKLDGNFYGTEESAFVCDTFAAHEEDAHGLGGDWIAAVEIHNGYIMYTLTYNGFAHLYYYCDNVEPECFDVPETDSALVIHKMNHTTNKWSPAMMTKMDLNGVRLLLFNGYTPLAMRVWTYEENEDDGLLCFVDNARASSDAYSEIWGIAHANKFRIIEMECDKLETNDPERPRIDCIWIKRDDLDAFRAVFADQFLQLATA